MGKEKIVDILSIRGRPRLVGRGIHREVYRLKDLAIKITRVRKGSETKEILEYAASADERNKRIRGELNFLPEYYGALITSIAGKRPSAVIVTFHSYVRPLTFPSLDELKKVFELVVSAYRKGYLLDWKPSNFGKRGKKIYYLDEYGIGKGLIPPDVAEDFNAFFNAMKKRLMAEMKRRTDP